MCWLDGVIFSQCKHLSNHHYVHFKYLNTLYVNYTSRKLKLKKIVTKNLMQEWPNKQTTIIRNETWDSTRDSADLKRIKGIVQTILHTPKFDNLDKKYPFLEKLKSPKLTKYEIR